MNRLIEARLLVLLVIIFLLPACPRPAVRPAPVAVPASLAKAKTATANARIGDPAKIDGRWHYRTRSNCSTEEGIGEVTFSWNAKARLYGEQGYIFWASQRQIFRWWGRERYREDAPALEGRLANSLGDTVEANWQLAPGRLVLHWKQSNGCHGEGTATPPEGLVAGLRIRRLLLQLGSPYESERIAAARALGEMGSQAISAIAQLLAVYQTAGGNVAQAAWDALEQIRR